MVFAIFAVFLTVHVASIVARDGEVELPVVIVAAAWQLLACLVLTSTWAAYPLCASAAARPVVPRNHAAERF